MVHGRFRALLFNPIVSASFTALVALLVVTAIWRIGVLEPLELRVYDQLTAIGARGQPPDTRLALVEVTEADIRQLGHWPLTDGEVAEVLERIHRLRPRAVVLDIYRDLEVIEQSGRSERERLAAAFRHYPATIATMKFGGVNSPTIPAPSFSAPQQVGFSNIIVDRDGNVRRGLL